MSWCPHWTPWATLLIICVYISYVPRSQDEGSPWSGPSLLIGITANALPAVYYVSGAAVSKAFTFVNVVNFHNHVNKDCDESRARGGETEAWRCEVTCPRSHG